MTMGCTRASISLAGIRGRSGIISPAAGFFRASISAPRFERIYSTYFADESVFPKGSVAFDCALIMRNIAHEWQAGAPMYI
jgi:hypothetical protein